jgi:hypothetical protein
MLSWEFLERGRPRHRRQALSVGPTDRKNRSREHNRSRSSKEWRKTCKGSESANGQLSYCKLDVIKGLSSLPCNAISSSFRNLFVSEK